MMAIITWQKKANYFSKKVHKNTKCIRITTGKKLGKRIKMYKFTNKIFGETRPLIYVFLTAAYANLWRGQQFPPVMMGRSMFYLWNPPLETSSNFKLLPCLHWVLRLLASLLYTYKLQPAPCGEFFLKNISHPVQIFVVFICLSPCDIAKWT